MTLELAGQITIACEKTGYSAQLEFKLKVRPCKANSTQGQLEEHSKRTLEVSQACGAGVSDLIIHTVCS